MHPSHSTQFVHHMFTIPLASVFSDIQNIAGINEALLSTAFGLYEEQEKYTETKRAAEVVDMTAQIENWRKEGAFKAVAIDNNMAMSKFDQVLSVRTSEKELANGTPNYVHTV